MEADGQIPTGRVRFGILGVARIATGGLIVPARSVPEVEVVAVASRSAEKARGFAQQHGVPRWVDGYQSLLADPEVDAVYIPLPNHLHKEWVLRALDMGKHVLCEKPLTCNAEEARELMAKASQSNRIVAEGLHLQYLPFVAKARAIVQSGELGKMEHLEAHLMIPWAPMAKDDFRLDPARGGGAGIDVGCYGVNMLRRIAGEEPTVVAARCGLARPQVDRWMKAKLEFAGGATGFLGCGFRGFYLPRFDIVIRFTNGSVRRTRAGLEVKGLNARVEQLDRISTLEVQLREFAHAVLGRKTRLPPLLDSVQNMTVIDAMYAAAGLKRRGDA